MANISYCRSNEEEEEEEVSISEPALLLDYNGHRLTSKVFQAAVEVVIVGGQRRGSTTYYNHPDHHLGRVRATKSIKWWSLKANC